MAVSAISEHHYVVHLLHVEPGATDDRKVRAAYFKDEGDFVVFKNAQHETVAAYRSELIESIERCSVDGPREHVG